MTAKEKNKPILLLAEDADDDAFFFKRIFEKTEQAFSLHHVFNGAAAIEFLRNGLKNKQLPQIIFLDLKMPLANGFDVLNWIREQKLPSTVSVYVLSGSEQQEDKERAQELGAIDYLVKPISATDLGRILQTVTPAPAGKAKTKPGAKK